MEIMDLKIGTNFSCHISFKVVIGRENLEKDCQWKAMVRV